MLNALLQDLCYGLRMLLLRRAQYRESCTASHQPMRRAGGGCVAAALSRVGRLLVPVRRSARIDPSEGCATSKEHPQTLSVDILLPTDANAGRILIVPGKHDDGVAGSCVWQLMLVASSSCSKGFNALSEHIFYFAQCGNCTA